MAYIIKNLCTEITLPIRFIGCFTIINNGIVDGMQWSTIIASNTIAAWIRQQEQNLWAELVDNSFPTFDIDNELLVIMKLKWQM